LLGCGRRPQRRPRQPCGGPAAIRCAGRAAAPVRGLRWVAAAAFSGGRRARF